MTETTAESRLRLAYTRVAALEADLQRLERDLDKVIDERDDAITAADDLAYAIAPPEIIGEHTSVNNPWTRALDLFDRQMPVARVEQ